MKTLHLQFWVSVESNKGTYFFYCCVLVQRKDKQQPGHILQKESHNINKSLKMYIKVVNAVVLFSYGNQELIETSLSYQNHKPPRLLVPLSVLPYFFWHWRIAETLSSVSNFASVLLQQKDAKAKRKKQSRVGLQHQNKSIIKIVSKEII